MERKNRESFGFRVMMTVIKLIVLILVFPYQVIINQKEGKFSIRSLAMVFAVNRKVNDEGKKSHDVKFSVPGYDFSEAYDKVRKRRAEWKKERRAAKKAEKRAKKAAKKAENTAEA